MKHRKIATALGALLLAVGLWRDAQAQDPPQSGQVEQSVKKAPEPPSKAPPAIDVQTARPEMKSDDDAKLKIKVDRFEITGNKAFTSDQLFTIIQGTRGKIGYEMTLAEVKGEAKLITDFYRSKGFPLAWAYIPAQEIKDGAVEIAVVEGRIDKVLVEGNRHYSSEFILDHLAGLQEGGGLTLAGLERGLLLLSEYPGLNVRATLRPGEDSGATDIYLNAEDKYPVMFSMDYDNYGQEDISRSRLGGTLGVANLFDAGHTMTLRGVQSLEVSQGNLYFARIDYVVPMTSGVKLRAYASHYDYEISEGHTAILEPTGRGEVWGLMLSYPIIKRQAMSFGAELGFEVKNLTQQLWGDVTTGEDRLRVVVVGLDYEIVEGLLGPKLPARWVLAAQVRQGLNEFAGGLGDDDPDSSRPMGIDGEFTRFSAQAYRIQKIASWITLLGKFSGQYVNEPLASTEQISLGGADSVRGYNPFEFMGDRGYTATVEARVNIPPLASVPDPFRKYPSIVDMVQLAGFVDWGSAKLVEDPTGGLRDTQTLSGCGVGLRLNYPDRLSLRFDVGWPLSHSGEDTVEEYDARIYYISAIVTVN